MSNPSMARPGLAVWAFRLACAVTIGLSGLIIINSLPYLTFRRDLAFLSEKGALVDDPVWRACFYGHIVGSIVCFASAPFLFWNGLLRRVPKLHRWLGRVYGIAVLGWSGPTGLYLAVHAKGGLPGKSAFLLMGLLWWGVTAKGVETIIARKTAEHRRWMVRSYAIALSAVFFRALHVGFYCPIRGRGKPSPLGDAFRRLAVQSRPPWSTNTARDHTPSTDCTSISCLQQSTASRY